jgi:hypothetical protein
MKKQSLLFAFFATISLGTAFAQKGTVLLGGSISISSLKTPQSSGDNKTTDVSFDPLIGYQFTDNLTAGVLVSVSSEKETTAAPYNYETKTTGFAGGPFIRYTHKISETFSVFGQLQGLFGSIKETNTTPPNPASETKNSFLNVGLFPAVFINLKNNFGLNFSFGGLGFTSFKPDEGKASTSIGFNFGQVANIGISKNFGMAKK